MLKPFRHLALLAALIAGAATTHPQALQAQDSAIVTTPPRDTAQHDTGAVSPAPDTTLHVTPTAPPYVPGTWWEKLIAMVLLVGVAAGGMKIFELLQQGIAWVDNLSPALKRAAIAAVTGLLVQAVTAIGGTLHVTDITQVTGADWAMLLTLGIGQVFKLLDDLRTNHAATVAAVAASAGTSATAAGVTTAAASAKAAAQ